MEQDQTVQGLGKGRPKGMFPEAAKGPLQAEADGAPKRKALMFTNW